MGKHDHPTLQMEVQKGRLVPLTPYEAEVLSTYSNGAVLTIEMHQKRSLPLLKKYWAVLRDVVDKCKTPWSSPDEASDALKLALGVTDIGKTVSGQWFIRAGSISFNSMDQAAFKKFFDDAMMVLASVTGIDPDELGKRYSHIPEHEPSDEGLSPDAGSGVETPSEPAADNPEPGGPAEAGEEADHDDAAPASDPVLRMKFEECRDKFLALASDKSVPEPKDRRDNIEFAKEAWKPELPDHLPFVKACMEAADRIVKGGKEADERKYLTGLIERVNHV